MAAGGLAVAGAAWFGARPLALRLFGPPPVRLVDEWAGLTGPRTVDHQVLGLVLERFVAASGDVDWSGLAADPADLDRYLAQIAVLPWDELGRDERLALLVNAYNACTLRLVLDHWPVASIRDIPAAERWLARRWTVAGWRLSLDQIEHAWLRPRFADPRIHFAINCASRGCPPLARRPYRGASIDASLEAAAVRTHADARFCRVAEGQVALTRLYEWFAGDFVQAAGSVLTFAARHHPQLARRLAAGERPRIAWLPWDWSLNRA